jgi:hypothetical protein
VSTLVLRILALIVMVVGAVLFFRPQIQAGTRLGGPRNWTPVWRNPVYGRKRSLWIGFAMMVVAANYVAWVGLARHG